MRVLSATVAKSSVSRSSRPFARSIFCCSKVQVRQESGGRTQVLRVRGWCCCPLPLAAACQATAHRYWKGAGGGGRNGSLGSSA